ncbi:bacillithiol system redox-active protein YtxJ [Alicyclobacillus sp. ALC3]|uniref:bacillithiol system redox-active protein YtxJ n=1 Tax=Alicyclobacillus sp. ALC3 TaxID=2796143 RepID=UPI00237896FE|nr:bacillithiol system redox-active protein YtxJ [Alicyclobacillus sp. ALC3]WDL97522.1 bacillithiol system redox-active protein YtxJ [Alicyclobacillus sp. ALC3]
MLQYREVTSLNEWQQVLQKSNERPALVFKHSTTCPISARAFREFIEYLGGTPNAHTDYVVVKVIESRPVSNQVASDLHVRHQSPQVILVQNQAAVWDTSHGSITEASLKQVLARG